MLLCLLLFLFEIVPREVAGGQLEDPLESASPQTLNSVALNL